MSSKQEPANNDQKTQRPEARIFVVFSHNDWVKLHTNALHLKNLEIM